MTLATYSLPVVIPIAAPDLGMAPESVGFLVSIIYLIGMVGGLFTGVLITRLGATKLFQLLLVLTAIAMLMLWSTLPVAAVACAIVLGIASGPMNPSGSHVLAPIVPLQQRSFIFSLKQCATPGGGILAGVLLPPLMLMFGWQSAILIIPLAAMILIVVAPVGRLDGQPSDALSNTSPFTDVKNAIVLVVSDPAIRSVTLAGVALAICQMGSATYLVVYLWREIGLTESAAGLVFAVLHLSGVISRIALGAIADRLLSARWVLVIVGLVLSFSLMVTGQFNATWSVIVIYSVTALTGASGNGWVGLYFAELARLAPPDKIAQVAGGSQFFTYAGLVMGPLLFGTLLKISDSYTFVFSVLSLIALVAALGLARASVR